MKERERLRISTTFCEEEGEVKDRRLFPLLPQKLFKGIPSQSAFPPIRQWSSTIRTNVPIFICNVVVGAVV